jgi:hypothetical protein
VSANALVAGYAPYLRVVDGADFDGTNDIMKRGADLTGNADSKKGILSFWFRIDGSNASDTMRAFCGLNSAGASTTNVLCERTAAFKFEITMRNSAVTDILKMSTAATTFGVSATWKHLLASWDLSTAGARSIYMSDVSDLSVTTFTDDTIDYTEADYVVGGANNTSSTFIFNGCLAEVYFAPGQYLDFSILAHRRKFISPSGKPVHLGTTGALPTGTAPLVYLHLDDGEAVANFATNRGSGGNFSITGTLDTASSSPSD